MKYITTSILFVVLLSLEPLAGQDYPYPTSEFGELFNYGIHRHLPYYVIRNVRRGMKITHYGHMPKLIETKDDSIRYFQLRPLYSPKTGQDENGRPFHIALWIRPLRDGPFQFYGADTIKNYQVDYDNFRLYKGHPWFKVIDAHAEITSYQRVDRDDRVAGGNVHRPVVYIWHDLANDSFTYYLMALYNDEKRLKEMGFLTGRWESHCPQNKACGHGVRPPAR